MGGDATATPCPTNAVVVTALLNADIKYRENGR